MTKLFYTICVTLLLLHTIQCSFFDTLFDTRTKQNDAVHLKDITSLVFKQNHMTTGRRNNPVSQMTCISNNKQQQELCNNNQPTSMLCKNVGYDGSDVVWQCNAELTTGVKLSDVTVSCEGFDSPNDNYVLKGSCGVEYTLTGQPTHKITNEHIEYNNNNMQQQQPSRQRVTNSPQQPPKTVVMSPAMLYNSDNNIIQSSKSYISSLADYIIPSPINRLLGRNKSTQQQQQQQQASRTYTNRIMDYVFGATIGNTLYNSIFGSSNSNKANTAANTFNRYTGSNIRESPYYDSTDDLLTTLLTYAIIAVVIYSLYKTYHNVVSGDNTSNANRRSATTSNSNNRNNHGFNAFRGFSQSLGSAAAASNNDDAIYDEPPSYHDSISHDNGSTVNNRSKTRITTQTMTQQQQPRRATSQQQQQDRSSGGSSFVTGAALGSVLGYMFGNRDSNNRNTYTQSVPTSTFLPRQQQPTRNVLHDNNIYDTHSTGGSRVESPTIVDRTAVEPDSTSSSTAYATTKRR